MSRITQVVLITLAAALLNGCAWFGASQAKKDLETVSTERVTVPSYLDTPAFDDLLPIPEIVDSRGLADSDYDVQMPQALSTSFGVEKIVLKRLDDDNWIFVDVPPSIVWPKIVQYWEVNNIDVAEANPGSGELISSWMTARNGEPTEVLNSLREGNVFSNTTNVSQHRFRLKVEPGIRSGSTEIYLEQMQMADDAPFFVAAEQWNDVSDDPELEREVLRSLAYYLSETVNQGSISMMATGLHDYSRAELIPDRERPVLKYKLDFNRAWATVGNALENARVDVEDLDRTSANYYVYYSSDHNPRPGFFSRLFGGGKGGSSSENRLTVHLVESDKEVHVTVLEADDELADAMVAERLLKVIKEYST